ncbi:MAG: preprotein translocase subunit SecG [Cellvibrionaceae bacterium]|jgi:preprotein translocase subunit SecG
MLAFLQSFSTWFSLIEIILAILITVLVLLQAKGSDLSSMMGGGDSSSSYRTKRGLEVVLHNWTIYLSILFFVMTIATFLSLGQTS